MLLIKLTPGRKTIYQQIIEFIRCEQAIRLNWYVLSLIEYFNECFNWLFNLMCRVGCIVKIFQNRMI